MTGGTIVKCSKPKVLHKKVGTNLTRESDVHWSVVPCACMMYLQPVRRTFTVKSRV